jgi:hypothetical protein
MKLTASPLEKFMKAAEDAITNAFGPTSIDLVHDRKRQIAQAVLGGATPPAEFVEAATIEELTAFELATLIIGKPDDLMIRENLRRQIILELRALTQADQIDPFLAGYGLVLRPSIASPLVLP